MVCDAAEYFSHMHTHKLQHKGSSNDMQVYLHQFHLKVQQGRGAIPIDLETPTSLCKRNVLLDRYFECGLICKRYKADVHPSVTFNFALV